jgi:hypothetical protein
VQTAPIFNVNNPSGQARSAACDNLGNSYSGDQNGNVIKYDSSGTVIWSNNFHPVSNVNGLAVDQNGFIYSNGSDGFVKKIDTNGNEVASLNVGVGPVTGYNLAVNPDGVIALAGGGAGFYYLISPDLSTYVVFEGSIGGGAINGIALQPGYFPVFFT